MAFGQTKANIKSYVIQKRWYWYVPLLLFGIYLFYSILQFDLKGSLPLVLLWPYAINFGIHEWAHIIAMLLPQILVAAAGSFSELLLGVITILLTFKNRLYFASMFGFLWLMFSARNVGFYMADSRAQQGELVSLGGALSGSTEATHDWAFIFGELGVLDYDIIIGNFMHVLGIIAGLFGLIFAAWLMYKMSKSSGAKTLTKKEEDLLLVASLQARKIKK